MPKFYYLLTTLIFTFLCFQLNAEPVNDTCRSDFERVFSTTNNLLTASFRAHPWDSSVNKPEQICWSFGDDRDTCIKYDPALSNNYYITHTYGKPGVYDVCVKILYQGGCISYKCKPIMLAGVTDSCSSKFETIASPSTPLGKYFVAQPFNSQHKKPVTICWSFGDNKDTCIKYPVVYTGTYGTFHLYDKPGYYNVCVKISYDGGCESHYCNYAEVNIPNSDSCRADFEKLSTNAENPLRVYYRALQWHNNNKKPEQICWSFGDDRDTCIKYDPSLSNNFFVAHNYEHTGTYNVCVKILYQGGCISYKCKQLQVGETDSCQANFETVTSASNSHGKYFIAQPWNKNGKKPVFICWNFGDNSDTCIQYSTSFDGHYAAFHSYAHAGNYNVCVKINYDGGCESYYCKTVQMVETDSCEADFEVGLMNSTSLGRHFVALPSNNHDKKPEQICWSFGDGRDTCITYPENYTGTYAIEHRYDHSGIYEACMKISYYGGCQAKKCKKFGIVYDLSPCDVHLFEITSSAISLVREFYFYSSNTKNPTHVCWNFGDGTDTCIAIEPDTEIPHTIKHTYPAPGVYKACIKIIFLNGCSATDCHEVAIRTLSDMCGGYYTDSLLNINSYVFKGFSVHKPDDAVVDYKWAFGDGTSGTGERVTHSYPDAGTYRVCLSINTEKGCETKICNDVKIAGNSQSALTLTPNPVSNILHATFISANNETVTIKISNSYGVAVKTYTRSAVVGSNTWDFENGDLLPGVYLFSVQSTNQFASNIFFKL